jgi:hypothetical protein
MATVVPPAGNFEMGRVFGRTIEVVGRNLALYMALAIVLVGLPTLVVQLMMPMSGDQNALLEGLRTGSVSLATLSTAFAIGGIVSWVFRSFLQATLVRATIEDLSDRRPNFADCFNTGLSQLGPIMLISLVSVVAIFFACFLLIVPGIMLAVAWSIAIPARVAERSGIRDSLSRSRALTKGHRWKIFFLLLLTAIGIGMVQSIIVGTFGAFGVIAGAVAAGVMAALTAAVMATLVATVYIELRRLKEGTDVSALATVFS